MKRLKIAVAGIATATLLVTGCSSGGTSSADDDKLITTEVEAGALPVTIEHQFGSTTIDQEPKRVVSVGLMEQDALLALGVAPVATTEWWGEKPGAIFEWATDDLGDRPLPERLAGDKIEFERIAALEPDLIVALYAGITEADYEKLSEIAPVVAHSKDQVDWGIGWQELTLTVGKAVGRPALAQQKVDEVNAQIADARAKNPQFGGKSGAFVTTYEGIWVYGPEDPRTRLMSDLGFVFPTGLNTLFEEDFGSTLSSEQAGLVDLDTVVWIGDEAATKKDIPTVAALNAAQQGRIVWLPEDDSAFYYAAGGFVSVLSVPFILDNLVPKLAAAVDGDPNTK